MAPQRRVFRARLNAGGVARRALPPAPRISRSCHAWPAASCSRISGLVFGLKSLFIASTGWRLGFGG
eukprot:13912605-Alexandrium_andersonii.AAC.1